MKTTEHNKQVMKTYNFWIGMFMLSLTMTITVLGAMGLPLTNFITFLGILTLIVGFKCLDQAEEEVLIKDMQK